MSRILITDDEEPIRAIMAAVLREYGHDVVETKSAREAIEEHQQTPADLIVTDLVMREMDGTELIRRIRAFSPQTAFIGISGARQGQIYLNMAKMLGADRVLAKPFTCDVFVDAVHTALGHAKTLAVSPAPERQP